MRGTPNTSNTAASSDAKKNAVVLPERIGNASLKTLDGKTMRLKDYMGKVIIVDLWATWCSPCRQEIPHLVELQEKYGAQGLQVVGLDLNDEPADTINSFARELKINYRLAWATQEFAGELLAGQDSIPQTYIISRDGKILQRFVGFHPIRTPEKMRQIIEDAIK
ncbi:MAG: hypothetical protein NVSMB56_14110 [Pyrinomonadaceae bacterium]